MESVGTEHAFGGAFVHRYTHSLDPKKRLTIPSEYREQVDDPKGFYVLPGIPERCLYLCPASEFALRMRKMREHSLADPTARAFARVLGSRSDLAKWDSAGRIRVKDELLEYAGLTDRVVLVGALDIIELWAPEVWEASGAMEQDKLAEAIRKAGF